MKKKLAMLFVVIMILSCMPVMAANVPAGADAASATNTVSVSAVKKGWIKTGSHYRYYVNGKYLKSQIRKIAGTYYGFNGSGYLQKGWFTLNGKKYYASPTRGAKGFGLVLTGYVKIGNYYYYFNPKNYGAMVTGLVKIGSKLYYFNGANGRQYRTKGQKIKTGGKYYVVQADGSLKVYDPTAGDPYGMNKKAQDYSSQTRYLILVNKTNHMVNVYQGSKGKWTLVRGNMQCTIGKSSTPTRSGNFNLSIQRKNNAYGWKDFKASTAFYAARINAGYYFHSILYKKGSRNPATAKVKDSRLGYNISNSCIRLKLENAKYIYNLPLRSAVIVYDR